MTHTIMIQLFILLIAGHYLADYALQNQYVADMKGRVHSEAHGIHALMAHGWHHALITGIIIQISGFGTGIAIGLGLVTGVHHAAIDYLGANHKAFGIHLDQLYHGLWLFVMCTIIAIVTYL